MTEFESVSPATLADEQAQVAVRESAVSFAGRVWDVRSDTFGYGDETLVRDYVDHPGAVAIVALDDADRVALIQQYRHPIHLRDWEIPAGLLDIAGEDPQHAAARELAEEVDLQADHWQLLTSVFPSPGGSSEVIHIYLARGLRQVSTEFVREGEEADMRRAWVPIGEVVDAILDGRLRNGTLTVGVLATVELLRRGTV